MDPVQLRPGTPEQFAAVRKLLDDCQYDDVHIGERLGLSSVGQYKQKEANEANVRADDALGILVRWFVEGGAVDRAVADAVLPPSAFEHFQALNLVAISSGGDSCYATVRLHPIESLYIVSDRWTNPDGSKFEMFDDIVYPADISNTGVFLSYMPETPCESLVDIGTGTGFLGLVAAQRYARRVWAFDIAARSTQFTDFNARLNGLSNVSVGIGDVYEPGAGLTFDRVVCHPPYVPVLTHTWTFHSGGEDGESITRKVIEGAPRHLRPGGKLYCGGMGSDRKEGPFEQRLRGWLGPEQGDFDVIIVVRKVLDPLHFAVNSLMKHQGDSAELVQWRNLFERLEVARLVSCIIVLQRRDAARPVFTRRVKEAPQSGPRHLEWLLSWETAVALGQVNVLDARISAGVDPKLQAVYKMGQQGAWEPVEHTLQVQHPYFSQWVVEAWAAWLLPRADGSRTGRELMTEMMREEIIRPDTPAREFGQALAELVSGGFLQVEGFLPPGPAGDVG